MTRSSTARVRAFRLGMTAAAMVPVVTFATNGGAATRRPLAGVTRTQAEKIFRSLDDQRIVFQSLSKKDGVARVLGEDQQLYTAVEIDGATTISKITMLTVVDTKSVSTAQQQVRYDALTCYDFAGPAAQKWCTGRMLDTNANGIVTASTSRTFRGLAITLSTYRSGNGSGPPVYSFVIQAA